MPNYEEMTDMGHSSTKKTAKEANDLKEILKERENEKEKEKEKGKVNEKEREKEKGKVNEKEKEKVRESEASNKSKIRELAKPPGSSSKTKIIDKDSKSTSSAIKPEADSRVKEVKNEKDFEERLKRAGNGLLVVDFYATWCIPCKVAAPQLDSLAEENKDVTFLKVDVDENEAIAVKYNVSTMPTFVLLKQGKVIETVIGFNVNKMEVLLKKHRGTDPVESKEKKKEK